MAELGTAEPRARARLPGSTMRKCLLLHLFLNPKRTERREENSVGCMKSGMENWDSSRDRMKALGKDEMRKVQ